MHEAAATEHFSDVPWRHPRRLGDGVRWLTAGLRALPDFLILGTQKGGTTTLHDALVGRPDVAAARYKEVHYFDLQQDLGERWYRSCFPTLHHLGRGANRLRTGEASPYYLFHPEVPARARALLPDAKLIAVLRNPIDRAFSHYQHECRAGRETATFEAAVSREMREYPRLVAAMRETPSRYSPAHHRLCYLHRGLYAEQLERWLRHYDREQLLVLKSEDLFEEPRRVLGEAVAFLGLDVDVPTRVSARNVGGYEVALPSPQRSVLTDFYTEPNARLAELLSRDFGWA